MSPSLRAVAGLTGVIAFGALTGAASAQTWSITLGPNNALTSTLQQGKVNVVAETQATVNVACQTGVDCSKAGLRLEQGGATVMSLGPPTTSAIGLTFAIPKAAVSPGTDLAVLFAGNKIGSFQIAPDGSSAAPTPPSPSSGGDAPTLAQLLALSCPGTYTAHYDAKNNIGEIVVTPLGVVLATALDRFDENDTLVVRVVGDVRLLPLLKAARTSPFRDVGTVRIVGGDQTVPLLQRQAGLVAQCGEQKFLLDNFAPGAGQVQISALQGTQLAPVGGFDFQVDPLYTGMLTLGAARTDLIDPGFKLASNGGQTVIVAGDTGSHDLIYTLFYTPFVWGKRDLRKPVPWYQHINPTIGVAPQHLSDNAMIGLSADLPAGVTLTFGRHFRRITVLPADTGLQVGSPFSGTADQLPTATEWKNANFWAISIDLRAMAQILRAALGTGGGTTP